MIIFSSPTICGHLTPNATVLPCYSPVLINATLLVSMFLPVQGLWIATLFFIVIFKQVLTVQQGEINTDAYADWSSFPSSFVSFFLFLYFIFFTKLHHLILWRNKKCYKPQTILDEGPQIHSKTGTYIVRQFLDLCTLLNLLDSKNFRKNGERDIFIVDILKIIDI